MQVAQMHAAPAAARLPARDRVILVAGIIVVSAVAWLYVAQLAADTDAMPMHGMPNAPALQPHGQPWSPTESALTFVMWSVMMVAMMTPTAAPMLLTFAGLTRAAAPPSSAVPASTVFLAGYVIVWTSFSAAATVLQWGLHTAGLLSNGYARAAPALAGTLLMLAGLYQFTALKRVCLTRCRSPIDFLMMEWRDGSTGALLMGLRHGRYCLGCCWALMLLLFAAGVMNLVWVALIAACVLIEKALPAGRWLTRPAGLLLAGWGSWLVLRAISG